MGFWEKVRNVAADLLEEAPELLLALAQKEAENREKIVRKYEHNLKERERKLSAAAKSDKMSNPEYAKKVKEAKQKLEMAKSKMHNENGSSGGNKLNSEKLELIEGRSLDEWERKWINLGILSSLTSEELREYNHSAGLYKAVMSGKIYYIGRAIEINNGGMRKRLIDYVRDNNSARTHKSGQKMNGNADRIHISILP